MDISFHLLLLFLIWCSHWRIQHVEAQNNLFPNGGFETNTKNGWLTPECTLSVYNDRVYEGFASGLANSQIPGTGPSIDLHRIITTAGYGSGTILEIRLRLSLPEGGPSGSASPNGALSSVSINEQMSGDNHVTTIPLFTRRVNGNGWTLFGGTYVVPEGLVLCEVQVQYPHQGVNFLVDDAYIGLYGQTPRWKMIANDNIDYYRKRQVSVEVHDASGLPVAGAAVRVTQLRRDFPFGSAIGDYLSLPGYTNFIRKHFSIGTAEWQMEWAAQQPRPSGSNWGPGDRLLQWCKENGIKLRGHSLFTEQVDHVQTWLQLLEKNALLTQINQRIDTAVTKYKGQLLSWDVNNEMLHGTFYSSRFNQSIWSYMFRRVRGLDANAKLFLNDYDNLETISDDKLFGLVKQTQSLMAEGAAVEGIGLEGHFQDVDPVLVESALDQLADNFGAAGVVMPLVISEFDTIQPDETLKADNLEAFYRVAFGHPNVTAILLANFWEGDDARAESAILNADFTPNEAGRRFEALMAEWNSTRDYVTDINGQVHFRGFYGTYTVEASIEHDAHTYATTTPEIALSKPKYPKLHKKGYNLHIDLAFNHPCMTLPWEGQTAMLGGDCASLTPPIASGHSCTLDCARGYGVNNGGTLYTVCESGTWSTLEGFCQARSCPMAPLLPGELAGNCRSGMLPGQSCAMACAAGYIQTGGAMQCVGLDAQNSHFDKTLSCQAVACAAPVLSRGQNLGSCIGRIFYSGDSCQLGCEAGYAQSGSGVATCTGTVAAASVFQYALTCTATVCATPDISSMAGAVLGNCGGHYSTGDSCTLGCAEGYHGPGTGGSYVAQCVGTGPGVSHFQYNFHCKAASCDRPDLTRRPHSVVVGDCDDKNTGELCMVECATGYSSVGRNGGMAGLAFSIQCTGTGRNATWSIPNYSCDPTPCAPPDVAGIAGVVLGTCNSATPYHTGQTCQLGCIAGWLGPGEGNVFTATCAGAGPAQSAFVFHVQCAPVCTDMPALIGINRITAGSCSVYDTVAEIAYGSTCALGCEDGWHVPAGESLSVTCRDGHWTTPPVAAHCFPSECELGGNGFMLDLGQDYGDCDDEQPLLTGATCNLRCMNGYFKDPRTSYLATCTATTASAQSLLKTNLICKPALCAPPQLLHTQTLGNCTGSLRTGDSCYLGCVHGYVQSGGWAECRGTNPSLSAFAFNLHCTAAVCPPPALAGGETLGECTVAQTTGQSCVLGCADGWFHSEGGVAVCTASGPGQSRYVHDLVCTAAACETVVLGAHQTHGACPERLHAGVTCMLACEAGYAQSGGEARCYGIAPGEAALEYNIQCNAVTCPLPSLGRGELLGACTIPQRTGEKCQLACQDGYELMGGVATCKGTTVGAAAYDYQLYCKPWVCQLPALGAGQGEGSCTLPYLTTGERCDRTCLPGFVRDVGTTVTSTCVARVGTIESNLLSNLACTDVDECLRPNACGAGWTCQNYPGTFACIPQAPLFTQTPAAVNLRWSALVAPPVVKVLWIQASTTSTFETIAAQRQLPAPTITTGSVGMTNGLVHGTTYFFRLYATVESVALGQSDVAGYATPAVLF